MRVGLLGGTFDPVHRGHLAVAAAAAEAFALDRVLFAPTGRQPLKPAITTDYADRLAMTLLACKGDSRFVASDLDAPRLNGSANYTLDLLTDLRELHRGDSVYAIAGLDSFLTLPHWRDPERLLALAEWIVVSRPGFAFDQLASAFDDARLPLSPEQRTRIHTLDTVHEEVSATELRNRLREGDSCFDLLPASVSEYILAHHLYTGQSEH